MPDDGTRNEDAMIDAFVDQHLQPGAVPTSVASRSAMLAPRTERPAPTPPVRDEAAESEDKQINQFLWGIGQRDRP